MSRTVAGRVESEAVIAKLACRQLGVVTRAQLLGVGLPRGQVERRVATGRLRAVHRGVYVVGPVEVPGAREMAATLACGDPAPVSHRSAAVLWELTAAQRRKRKVEVTVTRYRRHPGIRIHRTNRLFPDEVTRLHGIPITTPARTLLDIAGAVTPRELEQALASALARRLTTLEEVQKLLARHPRHRGHRALQALVETGEPAFTHSEAEDRFLELIRKGEVERPQVNVFFVGHKIDFLWRAERLAVEIDGYASHASPDAFERDRWRDADLAAAGVRVMRVTWRHLAKEPLAVLARVVQALETGRVQGG